MNPDPYRFSDRDLLMYYDNVLGYAHRMDAKGESGAIAHIRSINVFRFSSYKNNDYVYIDKKKYTFSFNTNLVQTIVLILVIFEDVHIRFELIGS